MARGVLGDVWFLPDIFLVYRLALYPSPMALSLQRINHETMRFSQFMLRDTLFVSESGYLFARLHQWKLSIKGDIVILNTKTLKSGPKIHGIPSLKLRKAPKANHPKRKVVSQPSILRGYVSFRGSKWFCWYLKPWRHFLDLVSPSVHKACNFSGRSGIVLLLVAALCVAPAWGTQLRISHDSHDDQRVLQTWYIWTYILCTHCTV